MNKIFECCSTSDLCSPTRSSFSSSVIFLLICSCVFLSLQFSSKSVQSIKAIFSARILNHIHFIFSKYYISLLISVKLCRWLLDLSLFLSKSPIKNFLKLALRVPRNNMSQVGENYLMRHSKTIQWRKLGKSLL